MSEAGRDRLLLAALASILCLINLGGTDLWAPDEPNFAEVAREMLVQGHWALPHDNGEVFTDKPPLFFWLIALISAPFGDVSSWTARIPSALAGVCAVLLTYEIGRILLGRVAAAAGSAIFLTSYMVFDKARSAQIDMLLCASILAALLCFLRAHRGGGRGWSIGFWIFCAAGTLAKGPVGLILPGGAVVVYLAVRRELASFRRLAPIAGLFVFSLIVGGWMLAAQRAGSPEGYSVLDALNRHVFQRFAVGMHHRKPFYYYLGALPRGIVPWTFFLPVALVAGFVEVWRAPKTGVSFLLAWFSFIFLFFSVSTEKRDLYVLPLYPAAALAIGRMLERSVVEGSLGRKWIEIPAWLSAVFAVGAGSGALLLSEGLARRLGGDPLSRLLDLWSGVYSPARFALALLLPAGLFAGFFLIRSSPGKATLAAGAGTCVVYLAVALWVMPAFNPHKSARPFCERIDREIGPRLGADETIAVYRFYRSALAFYSKQVRYKTIDAAGQLRSFLSSPKPVYVLSLAEDVSELSRYAPSGVRLEVAARGHIGHREYVLLVTRSLGDETGSPMARRLQPPALETLPALAVRSEHEAGSC